MHGPRCPIHQTPTEYLSTTNPYCYYCKACDTRYDEAFNSIADDWRYLVDDNIDKRSVIVEDIDEYVLGILRRGTLNIADRWEA